MQEGLISLNEKLTEAFSGDLPDSIDDNLKAATVRDLLTMCLGQEYGNLMGAQRPLYKEDDWVKMSLSIPFKFKPGTHFVYNALCAMTVGKVLGISYEQIKQGIASFELTQKRMDMKKLDNGALIINDAYNASFESMKVSLEFLSKHTGKRKIAVLGDMFELGEYTEELHRKVGEEVVKNKIDILICAGENSKYIIDEVKKHSNIKTYFMNNNEEIVEKLNQELKKGDVVLVKASNGMKFFEICQKV